VEGQPAANLKPRREVVVTPHPDVVSRWYQQAEFAKDIRQVYANCFHLWNAVEAEMEVKGDTTTEYVSVKTVCTGQI